MNDIKIFQSPDFGEIRTVTIKGETWFVGKDIATALGYVRPENAVTDRVDEDDRIFVDKKLVLELGIGFNHKELGQRGGWIVNESGMYALIFDSKLENAKKFKKWVTSEVLPSIRRTGSYGTPQLSDNPIELLKIHYAALEQVDKKVSDVGSKVETLEERFNKFEQELPMLPEDADEVHDSLNKRVIFLLGGKESNAYHDKSLSKKVFADAYRTLKYNFNVSRYKAIKRNQKAQALKIIEEYKPPLFLKEMIDEANTKKGARDDG